MTKPIRLQLSRRKGFNLQEASRAANGLPAVKVDRSTRFGNPSCCTRPYGCRHDPKYERWAWEEDGAGARCCVDDFSHYVETGLANEPTTTGILSIACDALLGYPRRKKLVEGLPILRGKNLACWCRLDQLCHADVLLELANRPCLTNIDASPESDVEERT